MPPSLPFIKWVVNNLVRPCHTLEHGDELGEGHLALRVKASAPNAVDEPMRNGVGDQAIIYQNLCVIASRSKKPYAARGYALGNGVQHGLSVRKHREFTVHLYRQRRLST